MRAPLWGPEDVEPELDPEHDLLVALDEIDDEDSYRHEVENGWWQL